MLRYSRGSRASIFSPRYSLRVRLTTKALEGGAPAAPNLGKSRGAKQIFARADIAEPGCRVMEQRFSLQRPAETLEPSCYPEAGSSWPGWPEASYETPSTKPMTTSRIETFSGSFFSSWVNIFSSSWAGTCGVGAQCFRKSFRSAG